MKCPLCDAELASDQLNTIMVHSKEDMPTCSFGYYVLTNNQVDAIQEAFLIRRKQGFDDAIDQMKELTADSCDPSVQVIHEEIRLLQPMGKK